MSTARLRLLPRPAHDGAHDLRPHVRALVLAAFPELAGLVERQGSELVDVLREVPAPRRALCRACRNGDISGAAKVGRKWLAPRAAVDSWLATLGPRPMPRADGRADDDLEDVRRSLVTPGRRPRRRAAG